MSHDLTIQITQLSHEGPSWLKNLYFAYLVVLRAIIKAEMLWNDYTFYTGNTDNDQLIKQEVLQLMKAAK